MRLEDIPIGARFKITTMNCYGTRVEIPEDMKTSGKCSYNSYGKITVLTLLDVDNEGFEFEGKHYIWTFPEHISDLSVLDYEED